MLHWVALAWCSGEILGDGHSGTSPHITIPLYSIKISLFFVAIHCLWWSILEWSRWGTETRSAIRSRCSSHGQGTDTMALGMAETEFSNSSLSQSANSDFLVSTNHYPLNSSSCSSYSFAFIHRFPAQDTCIQTVIFKTASGGKTFFKYLLSYPKNSERFTYCPQEFLSPGHSLSLGTRKLSSFRTREYFRFPSPSELNVVCSLPFRSSTHRISSTITVFIQLRKVHYST